MCLGLFMDIFREEGAGARVHDRQKGIIHLTVALGCFSEPDTSGGEPRNKYWQQ